MHQLCVNFSTKINRCDDKYLCKYKYLYKFKLNLLYIRIFGEVVEQRAEADRGRLEAGREEERSLQR